MQSTGDVANSPKESAIFETKQEAVTCGKNRIVGSILDCSVSVVNPIVCLGRVQCIASIGMNEFRTTLQSSADIASSPKRSDTIESGREAKNDGQNGVGGRLHLRLTK